MQDCPSKRCNNCQRPLQRVPVIKTGPATRFMSPWLPCAVCSVENLKRREQEKALEERRKDRQQRRRWIDDSNVGPYARHLTLKTSGCVQAVLDGYGGRPLPADVPRAVERFPGQKAAIELLLEGAHYKGGLLFLHGEYGTGKSVILKAATLDAIRAGHRAMYIEEGEMLQRLRPGGPDRAFEELAEVPVLCLDELGQGLVTTWSTAQLLALLNQRIRWARGTVIGSNLDPMGEQLGRYDGAVKSRIRGLFRHVAVTGGDLR